MIGQARRRGIKRILLDINTQKDFFMPTGKACINNRRRVLRRIRRLIAWARLTRMSVISTCQVYPADNGEQKYCVDGTEGQKKIGYSLLTRRVSFAADNSADVSPRLLKKYRQMVFHKRCIDPFNEPRIERLLSEINGAEFILIGALAETTVKAAALGLLQRGKKVIVVSDAVGYLNRQEADLAFRKMKAKGARLVKAKKLVGKSDVKMVAKDGFDQTGQREKQKGFHIAASY